MDLIVSQHLYVGNVTRTPANHKQDINVRDEGVTLTLQYKVEIKQPI